MMVTKKHTRSKRDNADRCFLNKKEEDNENNKNRRREINMLIYKCDKCGKELECSKGYSITLEERDGKIYDGHYELCDKCLKELRKWFKNAK